MTRFVASVLVGGLCLALFSAVGDRLGADTYLHVVVAVANANAPWFAAAFAVGAVQAGWRRGAVAAALALFVAVIVYYAAIYVAGNTVAELARTAGTWLALAALVAPPLGSAGAIWSAGSAGARGWAVSLLGGLFLAEAAHRLIQVEVWTGLDLTRSDVQVAAVDLLAAAVLPFLLLRAGERNGYVFAIPIAVVGALAMIVATGAVRLAMGG